MNESELPRWVYDTPEDGCEDPSGCNRAAISAALRQLTRAFRAHDDDLYDLMVRVLVVLRRPTKARPMTSELSPENLTPAAAPAAGTFSGA